MLDIDHFKAFNDRHGHALGDIVLKQFYATCRRELRKSDWLGRWGGEEFLLVSRGIASISVAPVFERLDRALAAIELPGAARGERIGFSLGACEAPTTPDVDLEALIKRADEALYEAKLAGRGCARVVQSPVVEPASMVSVAHAA